MITKNFPQTFRELWKKDNVRAAFVSEFEGCGCQNCGGAGFLVTFVAYKGPFKERPHDNSKKDTTVHFADGKWWIGESFQDLCPVCQ